MGWQQRTRRSSMPSPVCCWGSVTYSQSSAVCCRQRRLGPHLQILGGKRDANKAVVIGRAARLEQQHGCVRHGRQARRKYTASRAGTDNDCVRWRMDGEWMERMEKEDGPAHTVVIFLEQGLKMGGALVQQKDRRDGHAKRSKLPPHFESQWR